MLARIDNRKMALILALVVVMAAVISPLCQMVVCEMVPGAMSHSAGATFTRAVCDLGSMASAAPSGVVPAGSQSLLLALTVLVGVALMVVSPPRQLRLLRAVAEDPPAPPEDPRGVRLII